MVLVLLAGMGSPGLIIAYGLGISLSSVLSGLALWRRLDRDGERISPVRLLKSHISMTAGNYVSMIMGILPSTVVPIEVLIVLGPSATGHFAVAFTLAGFLNVIPSTVAQVLFAETSRQGVTLGAQLRKALRGTYGLLLPPLVVLMASAPLVLRLFGATYASTATACLRVLLLSAVFTGGTYLVDSVLIARDRIVAYTFMNGANAALVLGCVALLVPYGLTAGAWGWTVAQGLSLLLGMVVIATGRSGRHRAIARGAETRVPQVKPARRTVEAYEARIRELLETWPMMPTMLIAEQIGWDRPISLLRAQVADLRMDYLAEENYQEEGRLTARGGRALRYLVPARGGTGGRRPDAFSGRLAGAHHDHRPLAVSLCVAHPIHRCGGSPRRLLAATGEARCGTEGSCLEQPARGGTSAAERKERADQRVRRVRGGSGHEANHHGTGDSAEPGTCSRARTPTSSACSSLAGRSRRRGISTRSSPAGSRDQQPDDGGTRLLARGADGGRQASDAAASRGATGDWLASADDDRSAPVRQV